MTSDFLRKQFRLGSECMKLQTISGTPVSIWMDVGRNILPDDNECVINVIREDHLWGDDLYVAPPCNNNIISPGNPKSFTVILTRNVAYSLRRYCFKRQSENFDLNNYTVVWPSLHEYLTYEHKCWRSQLVRSVQNLTSDNTSLFFLLPPEIVEYILWFVTHGPFEPLDFRFMTCLQTHNKKQNWWRWTPVHVTDALVNDVDAEYFSESRPWLHNA
uniref:Uncharacterized protein n=1 Tax=viral metagenome TaxID=1070528 RepID=A0A2V0RC85_9ZZZZ